MERLETKLKDLRPHRTIDTLPIWNFNKIKETQDLRYMLKLEDYDELPEYKNDLTEVWEDVYYQVVDQFGESQQAEEYRRIKCQYWIALFQGIETGDKIYDNDLRRYKKQLDDLQKTFDKSFSFYEQVEVVERHRTVILDVFKTPVIKWFSYIRALEKEASRIKLKNLKNGRR